MVRDRMQSGYVYYRTEPIGGNYADGFEPDLTPAQMLQLGVFGGKYMTDCRPEFPASWSDDEIIHHISDVATDPAAATHTQGGATFANGTRHGVDIEVVIRNDEIRTGYPTNTPRNPP